MEDTTIKRDETPYLIFACKKCGGFSYIKTVQSTKKCLRCGRKHQVQDILKSGEVVLGMTEAVNTVKRKQNELSIPEFRSGSDFIVQTVNRTVRCVPNITKRRSLTDNNGFELAHKQKFTTMLLELSKLYKRFPKYMLELMAENYGIPPIELKILITKAKKSGMLLKNDNIDQYFTFYPTKQN